MEEIDRKLLDLFINHEKPLFFFSLRGDKDFPNCFSAGIGPTKYQRILNKEINIAPIQILFDL